MKLSDWALDPSLIYVALAACLYLLGSQGRGVPSLEKRSRSLPRCSRS